MNDPPQSILSVLNAYRPSIIDDLKQSFPEARAHLAVGGEIMGSADAGQALRAAALALLDNVSDIADKSAAATERNMRTARRLDLAGSLVGLSSTAGVVSALTGLISWISPLPLAIISFIGGAVPLVSGWLRTTEDGSSIPQVLSSLRDSVWKARILRGRIDRGDPVPELVESCNEIAAELARHLSALGCPEAVRPL